MSSVDITAIHERAARNKARRERLVTDWSDVVAAIHQDVISITDEFNTAPGYSGHQVGVHPCDRRTDLSVTTMADASLKWALAVNGCNRQLVVTCTTSKVQRTIGAPRFNDDDDLVVDEVVDGLPAAEMTPRAFILKTIAPLLAAVAER
jgi:hypothetical protein